MQRSHPARTLIIFLLAIAALFGGMALAKTWTPKLGLDLRGGTTITLTARNTTNSGQVDPASLELARSIIQSRVDSLGVGETEVATQGAQHIIVSVPNVQQDELLRLVGQTANLTFRAVYAEEAVQGAPASTSQPSASPTSTSSSASSASPTTSSPTTSSAAAPSATQQAGTGASPSATVNRGPMPQLPTAPPAPKSPRPTAVKSPEPSADPQRAAWLDALVAWQPSQRDQLDFADFTCGDPFPDVADQPLFSCSQDGAAKYLLGPVLVQGNDVTDAQAGVPNNQLNWVVNLQFNSQGASDFEKITGVLASRQEPMNRFAIVLDGAVVSSPSLQSSIPGGRAEISGSFTQASATELANVLRYGALPLAFDISSVDNVSATLGNDQLRAGIIAGLIGLGLVVLYSVLYYRGLSIVVVASLVIAALITWAVMTLLGHAMGFALNLPGIAGAIVAIGVTADSFIIYFERIRDEVRDGRSLRTAIESGWQKAKRTIVIADMVSLLSAVVLFILAIGGVKGFAFTLGLTTLVDLAIVFWFSKPLVSLLGRTRFYGGGHRWSGLDPSHLGVSRADFVPRTRRTSVKEA